MGNLLTILCPTRISQRDVKKVIDRHFLLRHDHHDDLSRRSNVRHLPVSSELPFNVISPHLATLYRQTLQVLMDS